jgi:hypothetical protein
MRYTINSTAVEGDQQIPTKKERKLISGLQLPGCSLARCIWTNNQCRFQTCLWPKTYSTEVNEGDMAKKDRLALVTVPLSA